MPPLGYSTNLHAAEALDEICASVVPFADALRRELGWAELGVDLKLGLAALPLGCTAATFAPLRRALDAAQLSAHTLNGFPLLPFHAARVKDDAYRPDWSDPERLTATQRLITAALALSDADLITISTLPGSYRPFGKRGHDASAIAAALGVAAATARQVFHATRRRVVIALEPEPWCFLETSADVAQFWRGALAREGVAAASAAFAGDVREGAVAIAEHLGVCFDTCHASVAFEDPAAAVTRLTEAGARIVKCQVSAAPEVRDPHRDAEGVAALAALAEPRFLHQTAAASGSAPHWRSRSRVRDLDQLAACLARLPSATCVRSHFHVPLAGPAPGGLATTLPDSRRGLAACLAAGCRHVAVETYTWPLLAATNSDPLTRIRHGTAAELRALADLCAGSPHARQTESP